MTKQEIAALACRILALYFVLKTLLLQIPFYVMPPISNIIQKIPGEFMFNNIPPIESLIYTLLIPFAISLTLWMSAPFLGRQIVRTMKDPQAKTSIKEIEMQTVFVSFMGFVLLVFSIVYLIMTAINYGFMVFNNEPNDYPWQLNFIQGAIPEIFQLAIGLLLVLKATKVSHFLNKKLRG